MSFAKPSYTFKLKSVLYSTDFPSRSATVCLDEVVYFTLEQTPKNWAVCNVRKGIAATKHVDQNKDSDAEIILSNLR